ncbi:MAG: trypsin-like peptidase domain-containing protein, partial [Clostridia bacterium]|nr:trypsin-like peptidase domain-containing protein [Clostridia bacterium]
EDGYIITNCHVVDGADKITVDLFNGDSFPAQLVGADSSFDVAVLKIEANGLPAVSVGDSDKLKVGEEVVAIGNPLGELTFTMTNGILSALDREINTDGNPQNMLQTNAAINSGNSGGPLFDMDGNVIGVTTAKYSGSTTSGTTIEGLGFAIPINDALKVAYDLVEHGYVKGQAYLGVTVATLDSQTASYYSLPVGPRVEQVSPGSCAEKAGIQVGDIILVCDGVEVENNPALLAELKKHRAGETIVLKVFRAGAELEITVLLDEKPSQAELDASIEEYEQQRQQQQQPQTQQPDQYQGEYYYQFPFGFDFFN